ncbi:MAG: hypothetical protein JO013_06730 [Alphaproteobacteria bacterium]|nr:hypothetical protein [Alphaproteobacteria bacterium]
MKALPSSLLWFAPTVFGAHALAYAVVQLLPDPINAVLGLQSGSNEARRALLEAQPVRTYVHTLTDLLRGHLGTTRDGVPVGQELARALSASAPRLAAAVALISAAVLVIAFLPRRRLAGAHAMTAALTFLPPFLAPFLMLWLYIESQAAAGTAADRLSWWLCTFSAALPAMAFASMQAALIMGRNLELPFARTIKAAGATESRIRVRLTHHLIGEMAPTLEKLGIGLFTALLFAEPAFGEDGLGSLTLRAVRRSDLDLIVALVAAMAAAIALLRVVSAATRSSYGVQTL